jgi:hypothetical protein
MPAASSNFQHFLGRSHFQIEWQVGCCLNPCDVGIADVAAVFAQVSGNAVTPYAGDNLCCANRVGVVAPAGIADCRDVINVDAQPQPLRIVNIDHQARLPGFVIGTAASSAGTSSSA